MSEIISQKLWLGDVDNAMDRNFLNENNISIVICCARELLYQLDDDYIDVVYFSISDDKDSDIDNYFDKVADLIHSSGKRVLIHCLAGINRSPILTASYLIKYYYLSTDEALKYIKDIRDEIDPHDEFVELLRKYETKIRNKEHNI